MKRRGRSNLENDPLPPDSDDRFADAWRDWAPNTRNWPKSWMGVEEDLEYGRKLLPFFEGFLKELFEEGLAKRTFAGYRDDLWLLGGSIISKVSIFDDYNIPPIDKLLDSIANDGILPDDYDTMSEATLDRFSRVCRRFEKFLRSRPR